MSRYHVWRAGLLAVLTCLLAVGAPATASPLDEAIAIKLSAQPLGDALRDLAKQSGLQLVFDPSLVEGQKAPAIAERLSPRDAFRRLLSGTELEAHEESPGVLTIRPRDANAGSVPGDPPSRPAAHSQAEQEAAADFALDEVVVTAQKREQDLQEVPIAITAIDRSQIEARDVQSARDLGGLVPGLTMTPEISYGQGARFFMRGMGTATLSLSRPSPVSVYLDGVYLGGNWGNILNLVDLTRVEALRGPQGTLYGRNSMAGTINLVSADPSGELAGYVSLDMSNYNGFVQKLQLDLPRIGIASFSISAYSNQRDGWVHATDRGMHHDVADINERSLRLDGLFQFTPDFSAEYTFDKANAHTNGMFLQVISANDTFFNRLGFPSVSQFGSKDRLTRASIDGNQFWRQETGGHSLTLDWQVNRDNTLKSITAYRDFETFANPDQDGTPYGIYISADPIPAGLQAWSDPSKPLFKYHQWSQELQWVGQARNLHYVGGLYYFTSNGRSQGTSSFFGLTHTDSAYEIEDSAFAVYGQIDYQPVDQLTLTAGVRKNFDKAELVNRVFGCRQSGLYCTPPPGSAFNYIIPPGTHGSTKFDSLTPVYAINWKFNEQLNVYARYAYGFLAGGYNTSVGNTSMSTADNIRLLLEPFKPQESKALEIGAKSTLFDGRFQGAIALSSTDYTNLQQAIFIPASHSGVLVRNANSATIRAAELEGAFVVVPGTVVRANYTWLDPEYNKAIENDPLTGQPHDYADNRSFGHAPRNSFGVSLDSRLAQFDWGTWQAHADFQYTSSMYMTSGVQLERSGPEYNPRAAVAGDSVVQGHGLLNMQLALTDIPMTSTMSAELALWCRNCTDKSIPNNVLDFGPNFGNLVLATFTAPVTYGLRATARW
ncbi:MAG: TonB-dependent receptor [Steroidobacteraceae bacterium]